MSNKIEICDTKLLELFEKMLSQTSHDTRMQLVENLNDSIDQEMMRNWIMNRYGEYSIHIVDKNGQYRFF